jgi:hypothetical protein
MYSLDVVTHLPDLRAVTWIQARQFTDQLNIVPYFILGDTDCSISL